MRVLGLHINGAQCAAALLQDGKVIHGAAEERFNRQKQSNAFPREAARWCLEAAGLGSLEDVDAVGISWNPSQSYTRAPSSIASWRGIADRLALTPDNLSALLPLEVLDENLVSRFGYSSNRKPEVYFVDHHMSHLAMASYHSPFDSAAVLIADEYSEANSLTFATVQDNTVDVLQKTPFPHSLGILYATITEFLGFRPNSDEWKVMGGAAFGEGERFYERLRSLTRLTTDPFDFELDLNYFEFQNLMVRGYSTGKLDAHLGVDRPVDGHLEQVHFDLAASCQKVFEDLLFEMLAWLHERTGMSNLVAAGGCFMNSLANGKIVGSTPFERLFVPYAAADNGGAVGSALWVHHQVLGQQRDPAYAFPSALVGPAYEDDEIEETLQRFKIPYTRVDDVVDATVKEILDGRIVGWFQGAMEFGERALGARSILADPRTLEMKDHINRAVKYREAFRPFAPSILEHRVHEWFDAPEGARVPYMEQVFAFRPEQRKKVPAVVHRDGTGRLQTVSAADNPLYFALIEAFEKATGVPIILNTSFNTQGEPIVCSPSDAIRTFFSSGLEVLVMGHFIVRKD